MKAVQRIRTQSTHESQPEEYGEGREYDAGEHAKRSERERLIEAEVERRGRADGDELARSGENAEANRPQKTQPQTRRERLFFICPLYFTQDALLLDCAAKVALCARIGLSY